MFFELAHNHNDDFPVNLDLPNGLVFNCDAGWQRINMHGRTLVFKGYHTESFSDAELFEQTVQDPTPRFGGNFCLVVCDQHNTVISHSHGRSFPLVHDGDTVSNLRPEHVPMGINEYLSVSTQFDVSRKFCEPLSTQYRKYSLEEGLDAVHEILTDYFERFLSRNTKPIKVFQTGGLDTTTVYTYMDHFTKDYELVDYEYHKFTHFYRRNYHTKVQKFWGYTHCHTWGDSPAVLATGAHGDDHFLRSQDLVNLMLMHHGEDIQDLLDRNPTCYHHRYLRQYKHMHDEQRESKLIQSAIASEQHIKKYIMNRVSNDYQHWHLDETLFFTPLANIKIIEVMMGLPSEVLVQQALHGEFNRMLIERVNPDSLKLISKEKNYQQMAQL
mgnify:CR=1 FL=1|tara:strand:- start:245 stop:1396 length:1152 start_codon:yes stop_codon:yes gene_type:complete